MKKSPNGKLKKRPEVRKCGEEEMNHMVPTTTKWVDRAKKDVDRNLFAKCPSVAISYLDEKTRGTTCLYQGHRWRQRKHCSLSWRSTPLPNWMLLHLSRTRFARAQLLRVCMSFLPSLPRELNQVRSSRGCMQVRSTHVKVTVSVDQ